MVLVLRAVHILRQYLIDSSQVMLPLVRMSPLAFVRVARLRVRIARVVAELTASLLVKIASLRVRIAIK